MKADRVPSSEPDLPITALSIAYGVPVATARESTRDCWEGAQACHGPRWAALAARLLASCRQRVTTKTFPFPAGLQVDHAPVSYVVSKTSSFSRLHLQAAGGLAGPDMASKVTTQWPQPSRRWAQNSWT